ncbi:oxidoreductase [Corallococcus exercitus]|uniref:SDR family NAD(P)-dependent oxidoreductase n=1 Tax=Corallococcus exercitus TaxID=2316736 RepID=A0A7Y4JRB1_9BACT|nr:oxidoreductase [Corallococcus exercitus]NOK09751.1 SDR family NAD(P)-dependent oxidoreductase [Corallococcus exercitus]
MTTDAKRVALVTGAGSGIGLATAKRLAQAGFTVAATGRKLHELEPLREAGCDTLTLDVTDEASLTAAVEAVEQRHGGIDVLINNAGYSQSGAIEAVPLERVRAQFETNVFGLVRLTQLVLPGMRARGSGHIVNLSSMGGKLTFPGGGYYHASKYAVEAISDALRFEVRGFGVHVTLIEPGLIHSRFAQAAVSALQEGAVPGPYDAFHSAVATATKESYEKGPLSKLAGTPDDVARTIEKALRAKNPRPRYTVSASATLLLTQKKLLTDRAWDRFLRGSFPSPGVA